MLFRSREYEVRERFVVPDDRLDLLDVELDCKTGMSIVLRAEWRPHSRHILSVKLKPYTTDGAMIRSSSLVGSSRRCARGRTWSTGIVSSMHGSFTENLRQLEGQPQRTRNGLLRVTLRSGVRHERRRRGLESGRSRHVIDGIEPSEITYQAP